MDLLFLVVSHDSIRECVRPSVGPSVRLSVRNAFVSAGRDEPTNDLFRGYELVQLTLAQNPLIIYAQEMFSNVTKITLSITFLSPRCHH